MTTKMTKGEQTEAEHRPGCTFDEERDEPGFGFGLAGGGYGPYSYCPMCGVILDKVQERE